MTRLLAEGGQGWSMPKLTRGSLETHEGPRKGLDAVAQLGNESTPPSRPAPLPAQLLPLQAQSQGYDGRKVPRSNLRLSFPSSGKSYLRKTSNMPLRQGAMPPSRAGQALQAKVKPASPPHCLEVEVLTGLQSQEQEDKSQPGFHTADTTPSLKKPKRQSSTKCGGHPGIGAALASCWVVLFPLALDKSHTSPPSRYKPKKTILSPTETS